VCKRKHIILNENCTILGYYAASSGNFVTTFRGNISALHPLLILEDGVDRLSRNVGKKLPLVAV